jgi:hypothetical protein
MASVNQEHFLLAKQIKELAYVIDSMGNRQAMDADRICNLEGAKKGITLRQWFAGQALVCGALCCVKPEVRIEWAFQIADSMIAFERGNPEGKKHETENRSNVVGAPGESDSALAEPAAGPKS